MNPLTTTTFELHTQPKSFSSKDEIFYPSTDPNAIPESDIHFTLIANLVLILRTFFQTRENVNVFGDLMFYYKEGDPRKFVAPDIMICFGIDKNPRRVYKLWEEKVVPAVIIELASESTWFKDVSTKIALYQKLGVKEYFIFDPEYAHLPAPLIGYRLEGDEYIEIEMENKRIFSESLELFFVDTGKTLRLFDSKTNEFLLTMEEMAIELARLKEQSSQ